ncbi:hypothetical protein ACKAV7_003714 [Fusarium commune]
MGTSRRPRARKCEKKTLRVFQANVGKVPPVHDCALALADSERYDIVLLQEPWTTTANSRCLTKTHPAYDTYSPVETWNSNSTRPSVMTYVRRDSTLSADQNRPYQSRDILWLTVNDTIIVNFYRQNDERDALHTLLQWPIPDRCLVAGDFNARHHTWQTGPTTNRGHEIASWASENDLGLLNTSDIPTNPHGNTIDLAFSNVPLAEANVEDHLATSSDRFTLSLTLPNVEPAPTHPGKIRVTTDDELKRFVEIVELGSTAIPVAASSPLELDKLASTLVSLLQSAAKAAGRPARKGARNAPWWTEECALAAAGYRAIRRLFPLGFNQEVQIAKRDFHRVVRRAKRLYWRNLINSFSDSSSVFKAVRWLRSPGAFQPPPLQVDDVVYETQLDKANALRRATLERRTAEDDIQDPWIEVSPRKTIPFPQEISLEEAQDATLRTGNTSPGADNITVKLLTAVWHIIGTHVRRLFEGCLAIGHHPKPFRAAEVVIVAKPGRRDLTNPRAWRPISLLSCLGKGLERYQDTITPLSPLQCGLPQGSPVSPILFLLYTEPIYRLSNPQGRFGYADDTAILCVGDTVEETAAAASRSVEEMVRWGAANGVSFDPKKTEVMHFSRNKPETAPAIRHGDVEKHPEAAMRWLGIWLDSNLSFRVHAEKWTAKAQAVAHHLRGLTNTIHGPLPSAVRSAVRACVEPVLLYGTEFNLCELYSLPGRRHRSPSSIGKAGYHLSLSFLKHVDTVSPPGSNPLMRPTPSRGARFHPGNPHTISSSSGSIKLQQRAASEPVFEGPMSSSYPVHDQPSCRNASARDKTHPYRQPRKGNRPRPSSKGAASYGFAIHQKDLSICDGSGRLGPAEVFDAEATGALEGLKAAPNLPGSAARDIVVCLDNLAAATCLRGTPSDSSQGVFVEFQALAASHGATQVRWIPGHTDIPGNEQADKLAKAASSLPEPEGA